MTATSRLLTGDDLWRWCDRLSLPVRHELVRDGGVTQWLVLPSLLAQLEDDVASTSGASGRSKPGSRPPLNVTALSLLGEIDCVLLDAVRGEGLQHRTGPIGDRLRQVVAHLVSTADPDVVDWWAHLIKGWAGEVQACLPGEDQGAGQIPIRGMSCPGCSSWSVERVADGLKFRDAALALVLHNRLVRHAICRSCGQSWPRGEPLRVLAESADDDTPQQTVMTRL